MVNPGAIKAILELYNQGFSIVAIAKHLNLHIEEIVNVINEYT